MVEKEFSLLRRAWGAVCRGFSFICRRRAKQPSSSPRRRPSKPETSCWPFVVGGGLRCRDDFVWHCPISFVEPGGNADGVSSTSFVLDPRPSTRRCRARPRMTKGNASGANSCPAKWRGLRQSTRPAQPAGSTEWSRLCRSTKGRDGVASLFAFGLRMRTAPPRACQLSASAPALASGASRLSADRIDRDP